MGGYGASDLKSILASLRNFFDQATLSKVMFGINEELPFSTSIVFAAGHAWIVLAIALLARMTRSLNDARVIVFLFTWICVAQLPTFQIWHIYPNLVGSRLFFIGSGALCLLLSLAVSGLIDRMSQSDDNRLAGYGARSLSLLTIIAAGALASCWFMALKHNLKPWQTAGSQMTSLRSQLVSLSDSIAPDKRILLLDLPQDLSGAGMVGQPEFLRIMLSEPLMKPEAASKIVSFYTLERQADRVAAGRQLIDRELLGETLKKPESGPVLIWSREKGKFVPWSRPEPTSTIKNLKLERVPAMVSGSVTWMPNESLARPLDPFAIDKIMIKLTGSRPETNANRLRLVWRSENQPESWIDYTHGPMGRIENGELVFSTTDIRAWLLNGPIVSLGLESTDGAIGFESWSIHSR